MLQVEAKKYHKRKNVVTNELINIEEPRICSHCKNTGIQTYISGCLTEGTHDKYQGTFIFACSFCGSNTLHFMLKGAPSNAIGMIGQYEFKSMETFPENFIKSMSIPENIASKFPDFFNIYNQAEEAEKAKLDKIAGMGYRKALEFLVTDFLIQYPTDSEITEEWLVNPATTLGSKINKLKNERIKILAKASSFIGNDETHYTRKHLEHDTESIKMFIKALLSDVENEIILREAEALINKPK